MAIAASFAGNLGRAAEIKTFDSGAKVCNFSVATNDRDRSGEKTTEWVRCSLWGRRGEALAEYLESGTKVFVSGKLTTRSYTTQSGEPRFSLELNVSEIELLGSTTSASSGGADRAASGDEITDDDIPF